MNRSTFLSVSLTALSLSAVVGWMIVDASQFDPAHLATVASALGGFKIAASLLPGTRKLAR